MLAVVELEQEPVLADSRLTHWALAVERTR